MKKVRSLFAPIFLGCIILSIVACGSGGGGGGGGESGSKNSDNCSHTPVISNLQYSPKSAIINNGGGSIDVSFLIDFVDNGGDLQNLLLNAWDSNGLLVDDIVFSLTHLNGVTTATLSLQLTVDTTKANNYSFAISFDDLQGCKSNKLTGQFLVGRLNGYTFLSSWGTRGTGNGEFFSPMGVAIGPSGNVYVADTSNRRVQVFTSNGTFIEMWGRNGGDGSSGSGIGEFNNPRAIDVGLDGRVYVGDSENYRVQTFSSDGTFLSQWSTYWAFDIAVDTSNYVYVPRPNMNGSIRKHYPNGTIVTEWTSGASPEGLAFDPSGYIYVAARPDNLIQKYTLNGILVNQWGTYGSGNGEFRDPRGIAVDMDGNVFVADSGNSRIQMFDSSGTFITSWGAGGTGNGEFNLPYGIDVDTQGNVYVADAYNDRIQVFAPIVVP